MQNAASQAMARKRRPVRCRNCGYVTTPVSGFCPNCLERLPLGRRVALVPLAVIAGLVALGAAVFAASGTRPLAVAPNTGQPSPSSSATAQTTSPTTAIGASPSLAASPAQSAASPSPSGSPSSSAALSGSPTPAGSSSVAPSPSSTPPPSQAVLATQNPPSASGTLPSTATSPGTGAATRRY